MKKHKICKILLVILAILLCVAFYELLGICIAYKKQPEVSNTTQKETKNGSWNECSENTERAVIIEKNPEALLQRVRLIQNAKAVSYTHLGDILKQLPLDLIKKEDAFSKDLLLLMLKQYNLFLESFQFACKNYKGNTNEADICLLYTSIVEIKSSAFWSILTAIAWTFSDAE